MIGAVASVARYMPDIVRAAAMSTESLKNASTDPEIGEYLCRHKSSLRFMSGALALCLYLMSVEKNRESHHIRNIGSVVPRMALLIDVADDIVDNKYFSFDDKCKFLDSIYGNLFGYNKHHGDGTLKEACYCMAQQLYSEFFHRDNGKKAEAVFDKMVSSVKKQFNEYDTDTLLALEKSVGASVVESMAAAIEIETSSDFPLTRKAAASIGEYGQLLDDWIDIDRDLAEGVNTYGTIKIQREGDTPQLRAEIERKYRRVAEESFQASLALFTDDRQRDIYRLMKKCISLRYML